MGANLYDRADQWLPGAGGGRGAGEDGFGTEKLSEVMCVFIGLPS